MTIQIRPSPASVLPPHGDPLRRWAIALLGLAPFFFGALALYLGEDTNWDIRNYHLYNAYAFLTGRWASGLDLMPSQSQFFLNPLPDVPNYFLANRFGPRVAGFVMGCVQGLGFPLLFMLAWVTLILPDTRRKFFACAGLAALGMLSALGLGELGAGFQDNLTGLGVLLSALLTLRYLEQLTDGEPSLAGPEARRAALLAFIFGIPAGLVAGAKMTCLPFCIAECSALLIVVPRRRGFLLAFFFGAGMLAGYAATFGWWAWQLYTVYGNPLFPYFNNIFRSPLLPPVPVWDYRTPPDVMTRLLFPFLFGLDPEIAASVPSRDWRLPLLYALMFIAFTVRQVRGAPQDPLAEERPARYLLWFGGAGYVVWLFVNTVYRYLLPLDALAPLLIVLCIGVMPWKKQARVETAMAVLLALALTTRPGDWGRYAHWNDTLVKMTPAPATLIVKPASALVLMAGPDPYAYLVPAFPPETGFVRIDSRSFPAEKDFGITKLARDKVDAHHGALMLFLPEDHFEDRLKALGPFNLALTPGSCHRLTDELWEARLENRAEPNTSSYPHYYKLCGLRKTHQK